MSGPDTKTKRGGARGNGYSLIEVLIAGAILAMGVVAAGAMALTVVAQQEANARIARALNVQEQAARLYHLGLEPAAIAQLLPPDPAIVSLTFENESTELLEGIGEIQSVDCTMTFRAASGTETWSPGTWVAGGTPLDRTQTLRVVRPTIR